MKHMIETAGRYQRWQREGSYQREDIKRERNEFLFRQPDLSERRKRNGVFGHGPAVSGCSFLFTKKATNIEKG